MSRTLEHTPLPWLNAMPPNPVSQAAAIAADTNPSRAVAIVLGTEPEDRANARLIIRACNNHYDLVAALRALLADIEQSQTEGRRVRGTLVVAAHQALAQVE